MEHKITVGVSAGANSYLDSMNQPIHQECVLGECLAQYLGRQHATLITLQNYFSHKRQSHESNNDLCSMVGFQMLVQPGMSKRIREA